MGRMAWACIWIVALPLIAWSLPKSDGTSIEPFQQGLPLRVGYAIEAPFAMVDDTGHVSGESPQIVRAITSKLGIPNIDWIYADFENLSADLKAGRIDVIAAGMYITAERQQEMLFTRPTARLSTGLLLHEDMAPAWQNLPDMARFPTSRLATIAGSVEEKLAQTAGFDANRIVSCPDATCAVEATLSGAADAMALSTVSLRQIQKQYGKDKLKLVPAFAKDGSQQVLNLPALAFRLQDKALRDHFDIELANYLGSTAHVQMALALGFSASEIQADKGIDQEKQP